MTNSRTQRRSQAVLIVSTLLASWWGMQAVHEFGHVLGAWATGGKVQQVALPPLGISRTDLSVNPRPLVVVWAGPIIGGLLPLALWGLASLLWRRGAFLFRFFAGFCLVANGGYIAFGSFDRIGDCGEMLRHGSSPWQLWLFGACTIPAGCWLWHGLGRFFGLGPDAQEIDSRAVVFTLAAALMLGALGVIGG